MILDDRPVIDQLLNPTPLNILTEVEEEAITWLNNSWGESMSDAEYDVAHAMMKRLIGELEARL